MANGTTAGAATDLATSNAILLSPREWLMAALIVAVFVIAAPRVWPSMQPFNPSVDYRIPFEFSEDYGLYRRLVDDCIDHDRLLLIGDSVIWGEYVTAEQSLSHYLNAQVGSPQFVNGGVNGTHPLALEGLVRDYAGGLSDRSVIVHCNLLWMSSPERDLQTDEAVEFNHPRLIPQLIPRVPAYQASADARMGILFDRCLAYRDLVEHLRISCFDSLDPYPWSLEHPDENPFTNFPPAAPTPSATLRHRPVSWTEQGIPMQEFPWVDLDGSLQWQAFCRTIELLEQRGNRVFVIVGPFNEHLLSAESRQSYRRLKSGVKEWLQAQGAAHFVPEALPSEEYADASHPLSSGYERLAEQLLSEAAFQQWLEER